VCEQKSNSGSFPDPEPDPKFELRIRILQIIPDPTGSGSGSGSGSDTLAAMWPCATIFLPKSATKKQCHMIRENGILLFHDRKRWVSVKRYGAVGNMFIYLAAILYVHKIGINFSSQHLQKHREMYCHQQKALSSG